MGIMYTGPYADQVHHPRQHEGYTDRRMPDGRYSGGETSAQFPHGAHVATVAACACGWRSPLEFPPTEAGERQAEQEWSNQHLQPIIDEEAAQHVLTGVDLLRFITGEQASADPDGAEVSRERQLGRTEVLQALENLLDDRARQPH